MAHIKSFSEGSPSGEYLYTIQNGQKILLGGPYVNPAHATAMSKAVSEAIGHGSIADYRAWLMENDSLFRPDTEMKGFYPEISESEKMAAKPFAMMARVSPEDWVRHVNYSVTKDIPWNSSNEERRAVARDKTDDLMNRMENPSYLDKINLSVGAGLHQGRQGLLGSALDLVFPTAREIRFPNYQDFVGNLSSIWDWEENAN